MSCMQTNHIFLIMASDTLFQKLCSTDLLSQAWETVKTKRSHGGVDGQSIDDFEKDYVRQIEELVRELSAGNWTPQPYLGISIPKNKTEKRRLGLLCIRDKIVQQGIKELIEPAFEEVFLSCSYGYRPGKGAVKAIRKALHECRQKNNALALKLDINDYFDNIDHNLLECEIDNIVHDDEILRLIMLCVKMGSIENRKWKDNDKGIPQGAVLSPLLANLYLHKFDEFILSKSLSYVRYADDFVIFIPNGTDERSILNEAQEFLSKDRKLTLNTPISNTLEAGIDFLKIHISRSGCTISERKATQLQEQISEFKLDENGLCESSASAWEGITRYYGKVCQQDELERIDSWLANSIEKKIRHNWRIFQSAKALTQSLQEIRFTSKVYQTKAPGIIESLKAIWSEARRASKELRSEENAKSIKARKREFLKKESENSEIIIRQPGAYLGMSKGRMTVKLKGKVIKQISIINLKHLIIMSEGVSLSSSFLNHLFKNKIPLNFFTKQGKHLGTFVHASLTQANLWGMQTSASPERNNHLAVEMISGKTTNQMNLVKYFHKYHKNKEDGDTESFNALCDAIKAFKEFTKNCNYSDPELTKVLVSHEATVALRYWAYVEHMLSDENIGFEGRIKQGAADTVNCMLNYGYSLLYSRIWNALLKYGLNPYCSIIHTRQPGKPTFVYDIIEIFRAQAVDRVVIAMIQKKAQINIVNGQIDDPSKSLLLKHLSERLTKRENFRGEEIMLSEIIDRQVRDIALYYLEGKTFKAYKAKW